MIWPKMYIIANYYLLRASYEDFISVYKDHYLKAFIKQHWINTKHY